MINRSWLYSTTWGLKNRTGYAYGGYGVHTTYDVSYPWNSNFHTQMGNSMAALSSISYDYGPGTVQWIGCGGVGGINCSNSSCHRNGTAFDLTAVRLGGIVVDCNMSWRTGDALAHRRYMGVAAALRKYGAYVQIYNDSDTRHQNHMHTDLYGQSMSGPLDVNSTKDRRLLATICNVLSGESVNVSSSYTPSWSELSAPYSRLLNKLGMNCKSPTSNWWHMQHFLTLIMQTGLAGVTAGTFRSYDC